MYEILKQLFELIKPFLTSFIENQKKIQKKVAAKIKPEKINSVIKKIKTSKRTPITVVTQDPLWQKRQSIKQNNNCDLLYDWSKFQAVKEGHKVQTGGFNYLEHVPFIRGIRDDRRANYFDDYFLITWREGFKIEGDKKAIIIKGSTRPGKTNQKAGILAPILQPEIWTFGKTNRFKYTRDIKIPVLFQRGPKPVHYYRDENMNLTVDSQDTKGKGWRGCQFHPGGFSNRRGRKVSGWSIMCQVVESINDYWCVISIFENYYKESKKRAKEGGVKWVQPYFSYAISKIENVPKKILKEIKKQ